MKEINIETLIANLQKLAEKGKTKVEIKGTLMCQQDGNSIIVSTEKQM